MSRYSVVPRKYWPAPETYTENVELLDAQRPKLGMTLDDIEAALQGATPVVSLYEEDDGSVIFPDTVEGNVMAHELCKQINEIEADQPILDTPPSRRWV